ITPQEPLYRRRQADAKLTSVWIVGMDIDREMDAAFAKPDEPAPVFLVGVNLGVSRVALNWRKKLVYDHGPADAALVNVLISIGNRDSLPEGQRIGTKEPQELGDR